MTVCPTCGQAREHRSKVSHDHFFVVVQNAFDNLPEDIGGDFASAEHLRKWALIKAGYRDERRVFCGSKVGAREVAKLVRSLDGGYGLVIVTGSMITIYTAKSQSLKAMGRVEFQKSKDDVLRVLAELIGADVVALTKAHAA